MEIFKNTEGYSSLVTNLEGYWERSFDDLPEELKPLVKRGFSICPWDGLDAAARRIRAQGYDSRNDPEHEPSTYYEIAKFYSDAEDNEKKAHDESNHMATVIWRDVLDRLNNILDIDRDRAGAEIQEIRRNVSDYKKLENEVTQLRLENAELKKNQSIDNEPNTKTKNYYLKTIRALAEALCDGLTGIKNKDADAVLAALAAKKVESPLISKTLAEYLREADEL